MEAMIERASDGSRSRERGRRRRDTRNQCDIGENGKKVAASLLMEMLTRYRKRYRRNVATRPMTVISCDRKREVKGREKERQRGRESERRERKTEGRGGLFFFPSLRLRLFFVTAKKKAARRGPPSSDGGRYVGRSVSSCSASVSFRAASRAQLASIFDSNTLKQYP